MFLFVLKGGIWVILYMSGSRSGTKWVSVHVGRRSMAVCLIGNSVFLIRSLGSVSRWMLTCSYDFLFSVCFLVSGSMIMSTHSSSLIRSLYVVRRKNS